TITSVVISNEVRNLSCRWNRSLVTLFLEITQCAASGFSGDAMPATPLCVISTVRTNLLSGLDRSLLAVLRRDDIWAQFIMARI
ncbi:MAG: hypothetical protein NTY51_11410, partial [Deltaproteobacteria bacterium]|nr:hypothetical protein [Deltaproteobacteria bacterium]